ncbi:uncharacterized protein LOC141908196 isoform X2 [Tubulanus polymorphus]|uniref:uncharacterized protein LOC141908196 isoform X2 n=1 Tax=Tubulanus polymorphus TaxID=672921 RepID=UPI003DA670A3
MVGISHNNVCLNSIFVGQDGGWKLGGMECAFRYMDAASNILENNKDIRDERAIPPEDKEKRQTMSYPLHARDAFGFGMLAELLMENLGELGAMTEEFALKMQNQFLNPDPNERPKLSTLLDDALFRNDFIEIMCFLKNITVKSDDEKEAFFSHIVEKLLRLPMQLVASRLVTPLLSRFVLLDAAANCHLVRHLLTPRIKGSKATYPEGTTPLLSEKLFKAHVIPELFKIFHVRDAHIRLVLLEHFPLYVAMFDKDTLTDVILPQVLLGLRDKNDNILALSLQALADLVPVIGGYAVVGRDRIKLFAEGRPKASGSCAKSTTTTTARRMSGSSTPNGKLLHIDEDDDGLIPVHSSISKTSQEVGQKNANENKKTRPARKDRNERRSPKKEKVTLKMLAKKSDFDVSSTPTQQCSAVEETDESEDKHLSDTGNELFVTGIEHKSEMDPKSSTESMRSVLAVEDVEGEEAEDEWSDWDDLPQLQNRVDETVNAENSVNSSQRFESHNFEVLNRQPSNNSSSTTKTVDESSPVKSAYTTSVELNTTNEVSSSVENKHPSVVRKDKLSRETRRGDDPDAGLSSIWAVAKTSYETRESSTANIKQRPRGTGAFSEIFDIKDIEIRSKTSKSDEIDDMFSDMQPDIKTQHVDLFSLLASSSTAAAAAAAADTATNSHISSSLAYTDEVTTETGGWGDDLDWADVDIEHTTSNQ